MTPQTMEPAWRRALDRFATRWDRSPEDPFSGAVQPSELEEFALCVEAEVRADLEEQLAGMFRAATEKIRAGAEVGR